MQNDPILAAFDTTLSLHWRINAAGLVLAFAHMHGEAATPAVGIRSVVVSRNGPILCAERVDFHAKRPHSRCIRHHPVSALANQCSWFDSGLRPYAWRGGNTSCGHPECGGESERSCSMCRKGGSSFLTTPFSLHSTPPCLCIGESMQLVCLWPSPTFMAKQERQLWASGVWW
jgi:hypothetical protein